MVDNTTARAGALRGGDEVMVFGDKAALPQLREVGDIVRLHRVKVRTKACVRGGGHARSSCVSALKCERRLHTCACIAACATQVDRYQNRPSFVVKLNRPSSLALFSRSEARRPTHTHALLVL